MTIGLGLACSHSPILYRPRCRWEEIYEKLTDPVSQPNSSVDETPAKLDQYFVRIQSSLMTLKEELEKYYVDMGISTRFNWNFMDRATLFF